MINTIKFKRKLITGITVLLLGIPVFGQTTHPKIQAGKPRKVQFKKMTKAIESQTYPNIHSVLIHYKGDLVYEGYFQGKDEAWGTDLGAVKHTANTLHDLRSLTKSIVSICMGIAIQKNLIESVDEKVFAFFPEHQDLDTGLHQLLTIKHLLTMTSGIDWNEDLPYTNPENSETAMLMSENPIRYVLSQPILTSPGKSWNYNGGTTELLAAILSRATGMDIEEFAVTYLFNPMEIETYFWTKSPGHRYPVAASGLRMLPKDILKIGVMLLNNGVYKGKEILNKQWITDSFTSQISRKNLSGYGYQFWVDPSPVAPASQMLVTAVGNGDQRIYLDRQKQLVVVTTAGNYNLWNIGKGSFQLLTDFIYPALE